MKSMDFLGEKPLSLILKKCLHFEVLDLYDKSGPELDVHCTALMLRPQSTRLVFICITPQKNKIFIKRYG